MAELGHFAELAARRPVASVFFGGGTPSLMRPATVAALLDGVAGLFTLEAGLEVTLEANPEDEARLGDFRAAGIDRLSLGVQSLDEASLKALGRGHSAAQARLALEHATSLFPRVSCDLIYARPGQTVADWRAELTEALARCGGHISLYQLTIERGTAFHRAQRQGALALPDEDTVAAMYEVSQTECAKAGIDGYEISNHAVAGEACRHNLNYWRGGDYIGIGPGAHGRLTTPAGRYATCQIRRPERWLEAVAAHGHGTQTIESLSLDDQAVEMLLMGLRLAEGVSRRAFARRSGRALDSFLSAERLARLEAAAFLSSDDDAVRLTPKGRRVLDAVVAELLA